MKSTLAWFALFFFFLANALTSHISASEFWPMTLSRELFKLPTPEISLFFKPTFHFLLALPHLLPLNDEYHILVSRALFAGIGFGIIFLSLQILKRIDAKSDFWSQMGFVGLLVLSPVFFSQIIKVRSDILSLFLSLAMIVVTTAKPPPWKPGRLLAIVTLHYLLLGSTPRALFHDVIAISFIFFYWSKELRSPDGLRQALISFVAPPLSLLIAFVGGLGGHLLHYFTESFTSSADQWNVLWSVLHKEILLAVLFVVSLVWVALQRGSNFRYLLIPSLLAIFSFLIADLKTYYLLASLLPFALLPVFAFLNSFRSKRLVLSLFSLLLISHFFLTERIDWWSSNKGQRDVIRKISGLLKEHPELTYFDGLGLLPRSPQILSYLGPDDEVALSSARDKVMTQKPSLIFYNQRIFLLGQGFLDYLLENYRTIGPDLYLRKDIQINLAVQFVEPPVLIFRTSPFEIN